MGLHPIVVRDFASRLRWGPSYAVLAGAVLAAAGLAYGAYRLALATQPWVPPAGFPTAGGVVAYPATAAYPVVPALTRDRGDLLYLAMCGGLVLIVGALVPGIASAAVSREREDATLDVVLVSPLSATSLVLGKLLGAVIQIAFLLALLLPAFAVVWVFGGTSVAVVSRSAAVLLALAGGLAAVSVAASCLTRTTLAAAVYAYGASFLLIGVTTVVYLAGAALGQDEHLRGVAAANPFVALLSTSPALHRQLVALAQPRAGALAADPALHLLGAEVSFPFWVGAVALYLAVGLLAVVVASLVLDPYHPLKTFRLRRRQRGYA